MSFTSVGGPECLLTIDAHAAALDGDAVRVNADVQAIQRIVDQLSESPVLIADLVSLAVLAENCSLVNDLLAEHPDIFTDQQLVELSHQLSAVRGGGTLRVRFDSERRMFEDILQRVYTDDGAGDGHPTAAGLRLLRRVYTDPDRTVDIPAAFVLDPLISAMIVGRAEMMAKYNELLTLAETDALVPLWERTGQSSAEQALQRLSSNSVDRFRYLLVVTLMPTLSRCSVNAELATLRRDASLAAIACELHRRKNGGWPAALDELTPRFLPGVPIDRFDGKLLRYRVVDGKPLIYSVGADLDDDGGREADTENARIEARRWRPLREYKTPVASEAGVVPDADWVLWRRAVE